MFVARKWPRVDGWERRGRPGDTQTLRGPGPPRTRVLANRPQSRARSRGRQAAAAPLNGLWPRLVLPVTEGPAADPVIRSENWKKAAGSGAHSPPGETKASSSAFCFAELTDYISQHPHCPPPWGDRAGASTCGPIQIPRKKEAGFITSPSGNQNASILA